MNLEEFSRQLKDKQSELRKLLAESAKAATMRAVEKATELTPPTFDSLSGTNTRSGELKQHWAADSVIDPQQIGDEYVTQLNNDKEYASYVNDGHQMDQHFVPGLVINEESGLLEFNPDGKGGIVVGTKTARVPGIFMADAAEQVYREVLERELNDRLEALFK